jgi:hypothetical protein
LLEARITPSYAIRATELNSLGVVEASNTQTSPLGPGNFFNAQFMLPDFSIVVVGNNSTTGPSFASHSTTINMLYTGPTGASSDSVLIEVLGDSYTTPPAGPAEITSNGSPSTGGLQASSVVMTSGVINGTATLSSTPGTTLSGQLGQTTGTGSIGSSSSVLSPNPTQSGGVFTIANPFTFYQTYTFGGFTTTNQAGSLSAGTTVNAFTSSPPVTIGDFVWNDVNANGCQDSGEVGIPGVTLTLMGTATGGGPVTDHATTDSSGHYLFTEVPGTYTVTVDASNFTGTGALAGYTASPTLNPSCGTALDSNPNPSGTTPGTLPGGSSDLTVDFGYYKPVTIGDFVWNDVNANGCQDSGEVGIPGVTLTLMGTNGSGVSVTDHATTDSTGHYLFTEAPGTYTVTVDASNFTGTGALVGFTASPTLNPSCGTALDSNPNPSGTTPGTLPGGSSDLTVDFGYHQPGPPGIEIDKTASVSNPAPFQPVTYTYQVSNPGGTPLANVVVTDDNGTPGNTADDFNPAPVLGNGSTSADSSHNIGDLNNNGLLDPSETWTYTATVIPPVAECQTINGTMTPIGTLIPLIAPAGTKAPNGASLAGDLEVIFNQSTAIVDNVYGSTTLASLPNFDGWGSANGHKFSDLTGSDQADLQFYGTGTSGLRLDFLADYIATPGTTGSLTITNGLGGTVSYPSKYGTAGVNSSISGTDGKLITDNTSQGSGKDIDYITTTITQNLNPTPPLTSAQVSSYTTNSPLPSADPNWNNVDGYTVFINPAAFGFTQSNFTVSDVGNIAIPYVHNSPSKISGTIKFMPTPCGGPVTNTATATATASGTPVSDTSTATVNITVPTPPPPVTAGTVTFSGKNVTVPLKNTGSATETLKSIAVSWPQATDGNLQTINLAAPQIYNGGPGGTALPPSGTLTITTFAGGPAAVNIGPGATPNLVFAFHNNVSAHGYSITLTFADGSQTIVSVPQLATGSTSQAGAGFSELLGAPGSLQPGPISFAVNLPQGPQAPAVQAAITSAVTTLNQEVAPLGLSLVQLSGADAGAAQVQISFASTSAIGGVGQGVMGAFGPGGQITLISGWNWYLGSDPNGIAPNQYDFQTVLSHELGHVLGLGENSDPSSAMSLYLSPGQVRRDLTATDLGAIEQELGSSPALLSVSPTAAGTAIATANANAAGSPVATSAPVATSDTSSVSLASAPAQAGATEAEASLAAAGAAAPSQVPPGGPALAVRTGDADRGVAPQTMTTESLVGLPATSAVATAPASSLAASTGAVVVSLVPGSAPVVTVLVAVPQSSAGADGSIVLAGEAGPVPAPALIQAVASAAGRIVVPAPGRALADGTDRGDRGLDQLLAACLADLPALDTAPPASRPPAGPGWVMSIPASAGGDGASLTTFTGLGLGDGALDVGSDGLADPGLTTGTRMLAVAALLTTYVGLRATRERDTKRTGRGRLPVWDGALNELYG